MVRHFWLPKKNLKQAFFPHSSYEFKYCCEYHLSCPPHTVLYQLDWRIEKVSEGPFINANKNLNSFYWKKKMLDLELGELRTKLFSLLSSGTPAKRKIKVWILKVVSCKSCCIYSPLILHHYVNVSYLLTSTRLNLNLTLTALASGNQHLPLKGTVSWQGRRVMSGINR